MSLRSRVLIGIVVVAVALAIGLTVVVRLQYRAEVDALDERLARVQELVPRATTNRPGTGGLAGTFVGRIEADGTITPINPLPADPTLRLLLPAAAHTGGPPFTVSASGATSVNLRVAVVMHNGAPTVFGFSLDEAEERNELLARGAMLLYGVIVLVLVGVGWQVLHLGVRPLCLMTDYADDLSAGRDPAPPPRFTQGTEADRLAQAFDGVLSEKDRAVDQLEAFVADTAHELLNPLSTITGYAQLYLAGRIDDRALTLDAMSRIDKEARRMGRIIEGLAELSLTRELPAGASQPVDVSTSVADLCLDLTAIHPRRPLHTDIVDGLFVLGDPDLLIQAIGALIRNALQHTTETVALTVAVQPAADPASGRMVRIEVADEGPGIDPAHLPHVFERFYRVEPSTGSGAGGIGLGLAVVASITKALHGRHGVSSSPAGSTFWLEFPSVAPAA